MPGDRTDHRDSGSGQEREVTRVLAIIEDPAYVPPYGGIASLTAREGTDHGSRTLVIERMRQPSESGASQNLSSACSGS